jgi:glycosyltransferase involved in cell wall biosynthesis
MGQASGSIKERTVLFISHKATLYGAERCCLDLILNLPPRIKPIVIVPGTGPFLDIIRKNKIDYYVMHFRGWWHKKFRLLYMPRVFSNLLAARKILRMLNGRKIQMVYSNTLYSPIGAFLAYALDVPHLWHAHEFVHLNHSDKFDFGSKFSMSFVDRFSAKIICTSGAHKADLASYIAPGKISIVHNGVAEKPRSERSRSPEKEYIILMIGSLTKNKGHADALRAFKVLLGRGIKAKLTIVGSGDDRYVSDLKALQEDCGLAGHVFWEGFRENPDDYIRAADVLLLCSRFETFGRVAIDAMSLGCPVIASNNGGRADIIDAGVNGLTYDHGDYEGLAEKILMLIRDKDLAIRIAENALATFRERFTTDRYVNNVVSVIDEIMNSTEKRSEAKTG